MHIHPSRLTKRETLIVNDKLSDPSSPEIQRMVKAYKKVEIYGDTGLKAALGLTAAGWEDAETNTPSAEYDD